MSSAAADAVVQLPLLVRGCWSLRSLALSLIALRLLFVLLLVCWSLLVCWQLGCRRELQRGGGSELS